VQARYDAIRIACTRAPPRNASWMLYNMMATTTVISAAYAALRDAAQNQSRGHVDDRHGGKEACEHRQPEHGQELSGFCTVAPAMLAGDRLRHLIGELTSTFRATRRSPLRRTLGGRRCGAWSAAGQD